MKKSGAYILYLEMPRSLTLKVGTLGRSSFPAGCYAYVGSASRGIDQRVSRHRRLDSGKTGKPHWHIDHLLLHPEVRWKGERPLPGKTECAVSRKIASSKGATAPVPGFGSTDCRAGCEAHLYKIGICKESHSWTRPRSSFIVKERRDS